MINKITFRNYKSFKERQELILKPITVLIGKNSSGKSAISKLPTLLAGSLSGNFSAPLKVENNGASLGLSYEDLIYNKNFVTSNLEFSLQSENEKLEVIITGDEKGNSKFIEYKYNGAPFDLDSTLFRGFKNNRIDFQNLKIPNDYIGPFRKIPGPFISNVSIEGKKIGDKGENAYQFLIHDFENETTLLSNVSTWYKNNFEGWKIEIIPIAGAPGSYQIVFSNKQVNRINIVNVGQGMNQALPLIVRSFMPDEEEVLIIIEEPETHLHPAAHGNLAERFVDSYKESLKKHYLIETHSQNFVLRLRSLVANGKLNKDDLAIYFVDFDEEKSESSIKLIEVDSKGEVSWWPENIFSENLKEIIAIRTAQES